MEKKERGVIRVTPYHYGLVQQYVVELAQTVNQMFADGKTDPSADEIAAAHFPGKALGGEIVAGIRKRLHKVRAVLEIDYEHPVTLVSGTYYSRFRHNPPIIDADARRCLPIGQGVSAEGIYLQRSATDLIWQAMVSLGLAQGAGRVKRSANRVLDAVEEQRLSERRAAELLAETQRRAAPTKPELAEQVMRALPGEGDDGEA